MILFYDDWAKEGAGPDWTTSNPHAIKQASLLDDMGVRNHAFHLALYDTRLKGINPHDPDLTPDIKRLMLIESRRNFWYLIREVVQVPPATGITPLQFRYHRANLALYWMYWNNIFSINVIARQRGKTMATVILMVILLLIQYNTTISSISKDDDLRVEIIRLMKKVYKNLPTWLHFRGKSDSRNNMEFTMKAFNNVFKMAVPSLNPTRAYKIGRGLTTPTTWSEESCASANIRISMGACLGSGTAAREQAAEIDAPSGIIMTTTAGMIDDRDASYVYELCMDACPFTEKLYDCKNKEELHKTIIANNKSGIAQVYSTFNHRQLGISDSRQREAIKMSTQSPADAERDFLSVWNRGSSGHPLPASILSTMANGIQEPSHIDIDPVNNFIVNWFGEEVARKRILATGVVAGLDPSEAVGLDGMSICLTDPVTGAVVATSAQSLASIPSYILWLYNTFIKPYPNLVMVVENKSTGQAIIDGLSELIMADGGNPFNRLFNRVVDESEQNPSRYEAVQGRPFGLKRLYESTKRIFGFKTTGSGNMARSKLYGEVFYSASKELASDLRCNTLVNQINGLIEKDNRIDHPSNGHDDLIIAWLLTQWFLRSAKNHSVYGVTTESILTDVSSHVSKDDPEARLQKSLKDRYDLLIDRIDEGVNMFEAQSIRHELKRLENTLGIIPIALTMEQGVTDTARRAKSDKESSKNNQQRKRKGNRTYRAVVPH